MTFHEQGATVISDMSVFPQPDVPDLDDQQGVLQCNIDVLAGTTASIKVDQDLQWPDDKVLR